VTITAPASRTRAGYIRGLGRTGPSAARPTPNGRVCSAEPTVSSSKLCGRRPIVPVTTRACFSEIVPAAWAAAVAACTWPASVRDDQVCHRTGRRLQSSTAQPMHP